MLSLESYHKQLALIGPEQTTRSTGGPDSQAVYSGTQIFAHAPNCFFTVICILAMQILCVRRMQLRILVRAAAEMNVLRVMCWP